MTKFVELTPQGCEALAVTKASYPSRGGGFEHYFWQRRVSEHLRTLIDRGEVSVERQINGVYIDVVAEFAEGRLLAIEIALTSTHERQNAERDLKEARCDWLVIACRDRRVLQGVETSLLDLHASLKERTRLCLLTQLMKWSLDELRDRKTNPTEEEE